MKQHRWFRITYTYNIPPREARAVPWGDREIAIFNLGNRFLALDNRCPHNGGPLAEGIVAGDEVVCPLHAWRVNLDSGCVNKPASVSACVEKFETKVESGVIHVLLPEPENKPPLTVLRVCSTVAPTTMAEAEQ